MELIEITEQGLPARAIDDLTEMVMEIICSTVELYQKNGYEPPWIGYLAIEKGKCVGACAFKTPPRNNEVEIAYFTFPDSEGRGIATGMASQLISIARRQMPLVTITAQTHLGNSASKSILKKLGFVFTGEIDHPDDGTVWEWKLPA